MSVLIALLVCIVLISGRYSVRSYDGKIRRILSPSKSLKWSFLLLFLVSALRYDVGYDYMQYYAYFYNMRGASYFEPLSKIFYYIAQKCNEPIVLYILFAIFILYFFYKGIKQWKNLDYYEMLIVFVCLFFLDSLSIMRQMMAVALVFWAYKYMENKKIWKFVVCTAVACLAHPTAIVALAVYYIYNYVSYRTAFIWSLIVIVVGPTVIDILLRIPYLSRFSVYLTSISSSGGGMIRYFFLGIWLLVMLAVHVFRWKSEISEKLMSVVTVGIAFPFVLGPQQGLRMALYFNVAYIILIPSILAGIPIRKKYIYMVPLYLFYILFLVVDKMNNSGYSPYILYFLK